MTNKEYRYSVVIAVTMGAVPKIISTEKLSVYISPKIHF